MTVDGLYQLLNYVDATLAKREEAVKIVLSEPGSIKLLLEIIGKNNNPISCKASWVLEFTARKELAIMYPYLDDFTNVIDKVILESSIRPMAKICELLIDDHFSANKDKSHKHIKNNHLELITSTCFDWLIGNHKVAPKAYAMTTLFLLGTEYDWIHPELKMVLEQNYVKSSAAYQARAKRVLKKLQRKKGKRT
ncbi:adenylosuccinate lyase [Maribacter sp. MMG018]|uniref:adenylosuccinate lyase n=1 Tax=Maribacter sp. MMG018 TaxID=2822688 RepID=UPI001B39A054|nr:adenylosuccinate lyase [Maribacter sp. MMG018]MBQ4914847.1 adenylosuccinate lyase [Maribacter sp. MMG018]